MSSSSNRQVSSPNSPVSYVEMSSDESSCVSSEPGETVKYYSPRSNRDQEAAAMLLVGCPRCLMYFLLSAEVDPCKCPKCKSTALLMLDFLNDDDTKKTTCRQLANLRTAS